MAEDSTYVCTLPLADGISQQGQDDTCQDDTRKTNKQTTKKRKDREWSELHPLEETLASLKVVFKIILLFTILYFFICSLGLLEDAFKLLGGRTAGQAFRDSDLLSNPLAGLMVGVLSTVLVQSSSTAISIMVAMVASEVVPLRTAIPFVMGSNIGTSVTNTLVSLAQVGDRAEFRKAFAGATVHDMFNWSAVIVLLPVELATGYLYHVTDAIVRSMNLKSDDYQMQLLTAITQPFTHLIVQVNHDIITDIAMAPNATTDSSVMKRWCQVSMIQKSVSVMRYDPVSVNCDRVGLNDPFYESCTCTHMKTNLSAGAGEVQVGLFVGWNVTEVVNETLHRTRCHSLFALTNASDKVAGGILVVVSIIVLLTSLFGIVKILNSMLKGSVAKVVHKTINADFPGRLACLTGYVALLVGCGMTMIIQSSSVFTSTLTPLVGVGIVSIERMFPMTLGANIGTTLTGILAAMSVKGEHLDQALQIALCHLFFNVTAVTIFYPIPFMRIPIPMAKLLGRVTSKYRWFAGLYLVFTFIIIPGTVFGLSYAGWIYLAAIGGPIFLLFLVITIINVLQSKRPGCLLRPLRTWNWLPLFLHSWRPYDRLISCRCLLDRCPRLDDSSDNNCNDEEYRVVEGEGVDDNCV